MAAGRNFDFKVVLLGEGCVGKTSLVLRYVENKFNDKHLTTLQASYLTKKLNIAGKRVNLSIWVKNWVKELRKMLGNEICLCIAGNKIDLEKDRHVTVAEAEAYAASVGARHFHTSAKMNKDMIEKAGSDTVTRPGKNNRRSVVVVDDSHTSQQSGGGGCCSSSS
ncbi:RAB21-like protein [Mya arenaria]|uniref:RAB21-like protein n=1 Tax=Mya arenaria TaxID=6604 RepID=A0ABY7EDW2_MYAAR|nr:RAB21-like protein [Mya arenaria]